jgi:uncharacterized protein YhbP (UPF0306 family)
MQTSINFDGFDYSNEVLNQSISDILNDNILLNLATIKSLNRPWISTLHFTYDAEMKLYVFTSPVSEHSKHIEKHSSVAVAIADSTQSPDIRKRGIQFTGKCRLAKEAELQTCINLYTARFPWFRKYIEKPEDFERSSLDSRFYIIEPRAIKVFDEVVFGSEIWIEAQIPRNK